MSRYRPEAEITELIIHCAATPNGVEYTAAHVNGWHGGRSFMRNPDALTGAGAWATKGPHASGLKHIGYHYVIRTNGVVEVGRRLSETGAHCRGHNHNSIGVCLIGTDVYTQAQWDALKQLVKAEIRDHGKRRLSAIAKRGSRADFPALSIHGHREFNTNKTCPGFDVAEWLANGMAPLKAHVLEAA